MQLNMVGSRGMPLGEAEHRRVHFRKDEWEDVAFGSGVLGSGRPSVS